MGLVVDTGPLLALTDRSDERHAAVLDFLRSTEESLFLSPFVLAEADHLIGRRLGVAPELRFLADVAAGDFVLDPLQAADVRACATVIDQYRDLGVGITDASLVVLAARHHTHRVLTFDQQHFRAMRALDGTPFVILPADEPAPGL